MHPALLPPEHSHVTDNVLVSYSFFACSSLDAFFPGFFFYIILCSSGFSCHKVSIVANKDASLKLLLEAMICFMSGIFCSGCFLRVQL